ncbi:ATP-dependent helicase, partial [Candidatus Pacearchaeota archaeon]
MESQLNKTARAENSSMDDFVKDTSNACVVFAGAGTGKTTAIIRKLKYIVENSIFSPERVVCLTFSREAANNLLMRFRREVRSENEPIIKTFHSFSAQLLKNRSLSNSRNGGRNSELKIPRNFQILEPNESKVILHNYFRLPPQKAHEYVNAISKAKDLGIDLEKFEVALNKLSPLSIEQLEQRIESANLEKLLKKSPSSRSATSEKIPTRILAQICEQKKFIQVWKRYEKLKARKTFLDYSDINLLALKLLREEPALASEFDYLIVDEFQDTNKIQLELLFALAPHGRVAVVGDMNQSIYRFRGAYEKNVESFISHFKVSEERIFKLNKSFRCPNTILRCANRLAMRFSA